MNARTFTRLVSPLARRIKLLASRGVGLLSDSSRAMQTLQIEGYAGEVLGSVEHFEPYGSTSNPLPGYEPILLSLGGRRSHVVCIVAADRRHRMRDLQPGEKAIHNHLGDYIVIRNGRIVEVFAGTKVQVTAPEVEVIAETKVTFNSPLAEFSGNVAIAGNLDAGGAVTGTTVSDATGPMQTMRDAFNGHGHPGGGAPVPQME